MNCRHKLFTAELAGLVLISSILIESFTAKPILASSGDDVSTLTEIVMNENRITGVNPESLALEERRLADRVTLITPTGLVKHVQRDAILAHLADLGKEVGDAKLSVEVSDVQVHLYGDTAVVTYQKQNKTLHVVGGHVHGTRPTNLTHGYLREARRRVESSGHRRSFAVARS